MKWKTGALLALALVLGVVYVRYFTDWSRPKSIQIFPLVRPQAGRAGAQPVAFMLDRERRLTSVRIWPVRDLRASETAPPIWALEAESNSVPTKAILYGVPVEGMRQRMPPKALEPGVPYRLEIEEGGLLGTVDFTTHGRVEPPKTVAPPPPPPSPFK